MHFLIMVIDIQNSMECQYISVGNQIAHISVACFFNLEWISSSVINSNGLKKMVHFRQWTGEPTAIYKWTLLSLYKL